MSLFLALIALSFLIFFHELGHFLAARFFGVKVEVFSIGFGKKLIKKTYGDTQYALSLIPLGGYVKMKGQEDSDPLAQNKESDSYSSKTPLQRIAILLAGPLFNLFLPLLIYTGIFYGQKDVLLPIVGEVQKDMPAFKSGLQSGDQIERINGEKVIVWNDVAEKIQRSDDKITLTILREGKRLNLEILPKALERENIFGEKQQVLVIGIKPIGEIGSVHYDMLDAFMLAIKQTFRSVMLILEGVQKLLLGIVSTSEIGGVISIVQVMDKAHESGMIQFFALVALISINLGILNLLPIPALDGGHIIFNLYELLSGKSPSVNALYYLTILGWAVLFSLIFLGFYNDINRIFKG